MSIRNRPSGYLSCAQSEIDAGAYETNHILYTASFNSFVLYTEGPLDVDVYGHYCKFYPIEYKGKKIKYNLKKVQCSGPVETEEYIPEKNKVSAHENEEKGWHYVQEAIKMATQFSNPAFGIIDKDLDSHNRYIEEIKTGAQNVAITFARDCETTLLYHYFDKFYGELLAIHGEQVEETIISNLCNIFLFSYRQGCFQKASFDLSENGTLEAFEKKALKQSTLYFFKEKDKKRGMCPYDFRKFYEEPFWANNTKCIVYEATHGNNHLKESLITRLVIRSEQIANSINADNFREAIKVWGREGTLGLNNNAEYKQIVKAICNYSHGHIVMGQIALFLRELDGKKHKNSSEGLADHFAMYVIKDASLKIGNELPITGLKKYLTDKKLYTEL